MAFDLEGITVSVLPPDQIAPGQWRKIQSLEREAFEVSNPNRSPAELDHLLDMTNFDSYLAGRMDPQFDIDRGRLRKEQIYRKPLATVALNGAELVGYMFTADNTSGGSFARQVKMQLPQRRYVWTRELVVDPDHQSNGIAHAMAYATLNPAYRKPNQPVSAWTWDEELKSHLVDNYGFIIMGHEPRQPFGENTEAVELYGLKANSAGTLRQQLAKELGQDVLALLKPNIH